jgi:hypothetical protein
VVGKQAIQIYNKNGHATNPGFKVLSYEPTFKEIQIADGWAYEWGETDARFTMSPEGPAVSLHIKGVRVLRRQSDRSWKNGTNHLDPITTARFSHHEPYRRRFRGCVI